MALRREECGCCPAEEEENEAVMLLSHRVKPIIGKVEFFVKKRPMKQAESVALLMN